MRRVLPPVALLLALAGCPRQEEIPPRPSTARSCLTDADCLPDAGVTCGLLPACIDRSCEAVPTRLVPCL